MGGGYPFWHSDLHLGPMSNQKGALVGIGGGYRVLAYVRGGGTTPLTSLLLVTCVVILVSLTIFEKHAVHRIEICLNPV